MTPGPRATGDAREEHVQVSVRYRPSGDVLLAQVDGVPDGAVRTDTPDADTTIEWVRRPDGTRHLVGCKVLFASVRAAEGRLSPALPPALDEQLRSLVTGVTGSLPEASDPMARHHLDVAVAARDLELPGDLSALDAPTPLAAPVTGRPEEAADLAGALTAVASGLDAALATGTDPGPSERLARALRELASTVAGAGGLTAPGCAAAARVAARGGTPLTARERKRLEAVLAGLDDPDTWAAAANTLTVIASRLGGGR